MDASEALQLHEEVRVWCSSGLLSLCGTSDVIARPPLGLVRGFATLERRLVDAAHRSGAVLEVHWPELVLGRAAIRGFSPHGRTSANGSCRLLATLDVPVAINLPRADDLAVLEALTEGPVGDDPWSALERWASRHSASAVIERTELLHLAAGALDGAAGDAVVTTQIAPPSEPKPLSDLKVVDLTSMWAGPLCANLLARLGASVLKVEARARRDGARLDERFYSWLHSADHGEILLDLGTPGGRAQLQDLLESADVILESSRPRALRQLGLDPDRLSLLDGVVWVAITARGPAEPMAVGFGDDAAVAGGLVATAPGGEVMFCGDAIADPITGMIAAAEVLEALHRGGGVHLGLSMAGCAASLIEQGHREASIELQSVRTDEGWQVDLAGELLDVVPPKLPVGV